MAFNFGSLATMQTVSTQKKRLAPWGIYAVKFAGAKIEEVKGKKDVNAVYKILRVRFENDEGYYDASIFLPDRNNSKDTINPEYTRADGTKYLTASAEERAAGLVSQIANALTPEGFKKMQEAASKFKTFDDFAKAFVTVVNKVVNVYTNIKLVGKTNANGQVEATHPNVVGFNNTSKEAYINNNFIGDKLYFNDYENTKRNEYLNSKPTQMKDDIIKVPEVEVKEDSDIDFDSLL